MIDIPDTCRRRPSDLEYCSRLRPVFFLYSPFPSKFLNNYPQYHSFLGVTWPWCRIKSLIADYHFGIIFLVTVQGFEGREH